MILGASHVMLRSGDPDRDVERVARLGFQPAFMERRLANSPEKRPFLRECPDFMVMAYCVAEAGLAIELVGYGPLVGTAAPPPAFSAVFSGTPGGESVIPPAPGESDLECLVAAALGLPVVAPHADPTFRTTMWRSGESDGRPGVRALLHPVSALESALTFWTRALRFTVESRGESRGRGWVLLALLGPVPRWHARVLLYEGRRPADPVMLDDPGCSCISLISSALTRDRQSLLEHGAPTSSGMFQLMVNGKDMALEIFRGPDGELVELVEFAQKRDGA